MSLIGNEPHHLSNACRWDPPHIRPKGKLGGVGYYSDNKQAFRPHKLKVTDAELMLMWRTGNAFIACRRVSRSIFLLKSNVSIIWQLMKGITHSIFRHFHYWQVFVSRDGLSGVLLSLLAKTQPWTHAALNSKFSPGRFVICQPPSICLTFSKLFNGTRNNLWKHTILVSNIPSWSISVYFVIILIFICREVQIQFPLVGSKSIKV